MALPAVAQVQQARGKATESYTARKLTPDVKDKAIRAAQLKAVEFYFAEAGEAETANYAASWDRIAQNLDRFVLDTTVLSEQDDPSSKKYTVAVRIDLNVAALRNELKSGSAVAKTARSQRSALAFVFVARQTGSKTTYQDRVYSRQDATAKAESDAKASVSGRAQSDSSQRTVEGESISKSSIGTSESVSSRENVDINLVGHAESNAKVSVTTELAAAPRERPARRPIECSLAVTSTAYSPKPLLVRDSGLRRPRILRRRQAASSRFQTWRLTTAEGMIFAHRRNRTLRPASRRRACHTSHSAPWTSV